MSELESTIEEKLIKVLTTGVSQWNYRQDLKNENDLWNNIREKLNASNANKLNGVLITDFEMEQIKEFIKTQAESPFKAGTWLSGENGLAQIPLKREDAKQGSISLDAIDNRQIKGGNSSYEVINQYVAFRDDSKDRNRRFDVTLLINGFPMIHIELKNQDHSIDEAFNQIKKYSGEGKFRGLFGLVQMFVVSNGTDTKYIAAATHDKLNKKFLISWVDKDNHRVDDYLSFAQHALNIPCAHELVGKYSMLDANTKSLLLLRPYQIHAIEAVKEASVHPDPKMRSGFVWHTTGSGKTITSFNVTRNLLDIPSIDKAIFLVDRKDLDQQTTLSFKSYAESTGDQIFETENTKYLEKALKSKDRIVIVATRQKMDCLLEKCKKAIANGDESAYYYKTAMKIKEKNVAFVVDECHRAISDQSKRIISEFFDTQFKKSLWYGFTGTPIFKENKKAECGQAARTTEQQYGRCLHKYTIKEALHDKAVLGFQVQSSGFSRQELEDIAEQLDLGKDSDFIEKADRADLEDKVLKAFKAKSENKNFYDSPQHREQVIDYICNKSVDLFRLKEPNGETFEAILTCSSIAEAQKYYIEFKDFISKGRIKEKIKRLKPDFPKIAITYSVSENDESSEVNQNMMKSYLEDYNKMFDTKWTLENIASYNSDLNARLARKSGKYKVRKEQLDLVIVVDRLLTGFDAPCLSTLFIDRQPMSPQGIIQAFSRTNRIYSDKKSWGHIVTFQTPAMFKKAFDKALDLYSNGGGNYVQAPSYEECKDRLITALAELKAYKENPQDIEISSSTDKSELKKFASLFQRFDKALAAVQTYEEWSSEAEKYISRESSNDVTNENHSDDNEINNYQELQETDIGVILKGITGLTVSQKELDTYTGKYHNVIEEIKNREDSDDPIELDINYELESVNQTQIDYSYLIALMQKYVPASDEDTVRQINDPSIEKYITNMEVKNRKLGEVIRGIWEQIKTEPSQFRGKQVIHVINDKIDLIINEKIESFCNEWCVERTDMRYFSKYYSKEIGLEISNMDKFCYFDEYVAKGGTLSKLRYRKLVREKAESLIAEEILPLRQR